MDANPVAQFFNPDGTLKNIPARQSKKIAVLQIIAKEFQTGNRYTEKEVNEILSKYHADTAALRRYMIQFAILNRDTTSEYWLV